jgi:hypothetical protein
MYIHTCDIHTCKYHTHTHTHTHTRIIHKHSSLPCSLFTVCEHCFRPTLHSSEQPRCWHWRATLIPPRPALVPPCVCAKREGAYARFTICKSESACVATRLAISEHVIQPRDLLADPGGCKGVGRIVAEVGRRIVAEAGRPADTVVVGDGRWAEAGRCLTAEGCRLAACPRFGVAAWPAALLRCPGEPGSSDHGPTEF